MAKRRLQCRQVFWRSGRSTASERAGRAPTGQRARTVAQQHRPARSVGARGGHEGPASTPGPHPTSESVPTLSERAGARECGRRGVARPLGTGADDDPSSPRRSSHSPSRSHVQPLPLPDPRSATALRKRPQTDVRSAWSSAFRSGLEPTRVQFSALLDARRHREPDRSSARIGYELRCGDGGRTHRTNGSDIFQRRCPHGDPKSTGEDLPRLDRDNKEASVPPRRSSASRPASDKNPITSTRRQTEPRSRRARGGPPGVSPLRL